MNTFSKFLTIFVTVASLAFLGFAGISTFAGPNWENEKEKLSDHFSFENSGGEQPTWTATRPGVSNNSPEFKTNSAVLADVVIACKKQLAKEQQERIDALNGQIPGLEERISIAARTNEADLAALDVRAGQLLDEIEAVRAESIATLKKVIGETAGTVDADDNAVPGAIQKRADLTERMKDAYRLRAELEEIRTEQYGIAEQKQKLQVLLIRMNAVLDRLQRRRNQLEKAGATFEKSDYSSDGTKPTPAASNGA
ncbi:MAG: hypothetical protein CMJ48_00020 [Planctomycetaceae bacterium]|nr:hypothetical protein [Planctomycetaceae bacterium]